MQEGEQFMSTIVEYEQVTDFRISIDDFGYGWESLSLLFNGTPISFRASYIGQEPLSTLISAVDALKSEYISESNRSRYFIDWISEPGSMRIALDHNLHDGRLSMGIRVSESENINDNSMKQWNFIMSYPLFRRAVVDVVISTLSKYGICGFNQNWDTEQDVLPIAALLSVMGASTCFDESTQTFRSDLTAELALLTSISK